jgi:hypothetical protein
MAEDNKTFSEILKNGTKVGVKLWQDNSAAYLTYNIPAFGFEEASEQALIRLVSGLESFSRVPAEYTRQAGISDAEDDNGSPVIELTFVLGNI